jgi:hypothetical protein
VRSQLNQYDEWSDDGIEAYLGDKTDIQYQQQSEVDLARE